MKKKKLKVLIDWSGDCFGAVSPDIDGCVAVSATLAEVKADYKISLEMHSEFAQENNLPDWIVGGAFEFDWELTASALLKHYSSMVSLSAISKATGINQKQLSHYLNGHRTPRADKRSSIVQGLHAIGTELLLAQ